MFLHVTHVQYLHDYQIQVTFNNGKTGIADLSVALTGGVFSELQNQNLFAQVRVDDELNTLVWPNGADLAPEYIYFQAFKQEKNLQEQFKQWRYI